MKKSFVFQNSLPVGPLKLAALEIFCFSKFPACRPVKACGFRKLQGSGPKGKRSYCYIPEE